MRWVSDFLFLSEITVFTQAVIQVEIKLAEGRGEAGGRSDPKVRVEGSQVGLGEGWNTEEESRAGDLTWLTLAHHTRLNIQSALTFTDWTENDITEVLKSLKNRKCQDWLGMINEIFKPLVASTDLVRLLCLMMNNIKDKCYVTDLLISRSHVFAELTN